MYERLELLERLLRRVPASACTVCRGGSAVAVVLQRDGAHDITLDAREAFQLAWHGLLPEVVVASLVAAEIVPSALMRRGGAGTARPLPGG